MRKPYIEANAGEVATSVLLPGDPMRAKYIAESFLGNSVLFNGALGALGFTGTYRGRRVSVLGSGMGIPSVSIYANELYRLYGVENIIRIGTCGTARPDISIGDLLLAQGCSTTSEINRRIFNSGTFCPIADFDMLKTAYDSAVAEGKSVRVGNLLSTDLFYDLAKIPNDDLWWKFGVLGVEMEGAGLYTAAMRNAKRALMMCTVSDSIVDRKGMPPSQRERSLNEMIELGLETIWQFCES